MNVPAFAKVRVIDVSTLTVVMLAGVSVGESKTTVCPTEPNANVTLPPGAIVTVPGSNARLVVAATVAVCGEAVGVVGAVGSVAPPELDAEPYPDAPQAKRPLINPAESNVDMTRCMFECLV